MSKESEFMDKMLPKAVDLGASLFQVSLQTTVMRHLANEPKKGSCNFMNYWFSYVRKSVLSEFFVSIYWFPVLISRVDQRQTSCRCKVRQIHRESNAIQSSIGHCRWCRQYSRSSSVGHGIRHPPTVTATTVVTTYHHHHRLWGGDRAHNWFYRGRVLILCFSMSWFYIYIFYW